MTTFKEYKEIRLRGIEATQDHRGGYVLNGMFYYPMATNIGIGCVEAKDWVASVDIKSGNGSMGFGKWQD